jgi:hypothetical protein
LQRLLHRTLKIPGSGLAVKAPIRFEQVEHPPLDDISRDARGQVRPGAPPFRRLVNRATRAAHPIENPEEP